MAVTKIKKVASGTLIALSLISLAVFIAFYAGGYELNEKGNKVYKLTDVLLIWTYVLIGLAVLSTVVFAVKSLIESFQRDSKKALLSIGGFLALIILLAVSYFMGDASGTYGKDNDKLPKLLFEDKTTWIQVTDMFIYATYVLLGLNVVAVLLGGVKSLIKK